MDAVSIGLSATAAQQASNALAKAKDIECKLIINEFDAKTATVEMMQTYADCVDRIYPSSMSPTEELFLKFLFVSLIVGGVAGFFYSIKNGWNEVSDSVIFSVLWGIITPIIVVFIALFVRGLFWLFS